MSGCRRSYIFRRAAEKLYHRFAAVISAAKPRVMFFAPVGQKVFVGEGRCGCRRSYIFRRAAEKLYRRFAAVISAAKPRVMFFAPVGQKVKVCPPCGHIFIGGMCSDNASLTVTVVTLPHQNVPRPAAHLNILSPKGDKIFHTREARISPRRRRDFTRRCASHRRISLLCCRKAAQQ